MAVKKTNHNYMAIPRFPREFKVAGTYSKSDYKDSYGNVDNWYGFMIGDDDTRIGVVEYDGYTVDYSGRGFSIGQVILGNIKSIELDSGIIDVQVHG